MDSTVAADFSLTTGGAAQPASHLQAASSLAEYVSNSSSQVSVIPLHVMGAQTPAIVVLSNTHQVVSLKLTNTNYFY